MDAHLVTHLKAKPPAEIIDRRLGHMDRMRGLKIRHSTTTLFRGYRNETPALSLMLRSSVNSGTEMKTDKYRADGSVSSGLEAIAKLVGIQVIAFERSFPASRPGHRARRTGSRAAHYGKQNPRRGGQGQAGGWLEASDRTRCQPKDPWNWNAEQGFTQARFLSRASSF
jgi:hypothetical protein